MSYASTSVAPGSFPGVRRKFTTGVAVTGAGILALGLVVVPPDFDDARTGLRTVQYTSLALPSAPSPAVEQFVGYLIGTHARVPIAIFSGDASDLSTSSTTSPHTSAGGQLSTKDAEALALTPESAQGDNAALAETPTGGSILDPILPIIGPIILFAPLFIILIPLLPVLLPGAILFWIQSGALSLSELTSPPPDPAAASSAIVEPDAAVASDRLPSDYGLDAVTTEHQPKGTPSGRKGHGRGTFGCRGGSALVREEANPDRIDSFRRGCGQACRGNPVVRVTEASHPADDDEFVSRAWIDRGQ